MESKKNQILDITLPGRHLLEGHCHPLIELAEDCQHFLQKLGYEKGDPPLQKADFDDGNNEAGIRKAEFTEGKSVFSWKTQEVEGRKHLVLSVVYQQKKAGVPLLKGTVESLLAEFLPSDAEWRGRFLPPEAGFEFAIEGLHRGLKPAWREILYAGRILGRLNGRRVSYGFYFEIRLEQLASTLYGVDNAEEFYENDYIFLRQFML